MVIEYELILQVAIAAILGGIIGYEREKIKRPAGLRTHILVCVGSTIAMQTNIFLMANHLGTVNVDPSRIGASVVSGIGFLGAGTIIREGASVKGLTTAASLWAVACIGLAVGSGFYVGSIAGTVIILLTLTLFVRVERKISFSASAYSLEIITISHPGQLGKIGTILGKVDTKINEITIEPHDDNLSSVLVTILPPRDIKISKIISLLGDIEDVKSVTRIV